MYVRLLRGNPQLKPRTENATLFGRVHNNKRTVMLIISKYVTLNFELSNNLVFNKTIIF